jgi:hypothetical protein
MSLIGGPFKSAAQYYMANFWPIALKLPGVKNEDPNTIFIERNPERIGKWSKKYKDVGVDVYADFEASAYKQNPLFDKDKKGYITYGDMINQVNINKKNPLYSQALAAMQEVGYAATKDTAVAENDNDISKTIKNYNPDEKSMWDQISGKTRPSQNKPGVKPVAGPVAENDSGIMSTIEKYLHLAASLEKSNKSLYKKYLPHNNIIIKINSNNYTNSVEFGRVLCSILDEELMSKSFVHTDGKNIEVECSIPGPSNNCLNIVKQLTSAAQEAFEEATLKIGGVEVKSSFIMDKKSSYQPINLKIALQQYDTFTRKFS